MRIILPNFITYNDQNYFNLKYFLKYWLHRSLICDSKTDVISGITHRHSVAFLSIQV